MSNMRAQGATEYLVAIAVVIFLALAAIVLLGFFPGTATDTQVSQSQLYWGATGPISIIEATAVPQSSGISMPYIKLRNKEVYPITITGIISNNQSISTLVNGTAPSCFQLAPGGEVSIGDSGYFSLSTNCSVSITSGGSSSGTTLAGASQLCSNSSSPGSLVIDSFGFTYQTQAGITKKQYGKPLVIKCTAYVAPVCASEGGSCASASCCSGFYCINYVLPSDTSIPDNLCHTCGNTTMGTCEAGSACAPSCNGNWTYQCRKLACPF